MGNKYESGGFDFLKSMVQSFFIVVTLISAAVFVLGKTFQPEAQFGYEVLWFPIKCGFFSMLPSAIMYSKKELTVKQLLGRKALQLVLIILIVEGLVLGANALDAAYLRDALSIGASIIMIYMMAGAISYFLGRREAKKLTDDLAAYQKRFEAE